MSVVAPSPAPKAEVRPDLALRDTPGGSRTFATTRWSVVVAAGGGGSAARRALGTLCGQAWYPLYAFARRAGLTHDDAADAVQAFFADLLEKGWVKDADAARSRFRTFLRVAFRGHLARRREAAGALKRGGAVRTLSLTPAGMDGAAAAARYAREPHHTQTAEALFERRWALDLLDRALARLDAEHAGEKAARFAALKPCLTGSADANYAVLGEELGMTGDAVKQAVRRLRGRFREVLRAEVADTVAAPGEVADELRALRASL